MMGDLLSEEGKKLWATLELFAGAGVGKHDFEFFRKNRECLNQLCKLMRYLADNYNERAMQAINDLIGESEHFNPGFICLLLEEYGWEIEDCERPHKVFARKIINGKKVRLLIIMSRISAEVRIFFYEDPSPLFANQYKLFKEHAKIEKLREIMKDPCKFKK